MSWYWDREDRNDGPSMTTDEPVRTEPQVVLFFSANDPEVARTAVVVCGTEGWPANVSRDGEVAVRVPEMRVVGLLRRLDGRGIRPTRVSMRLARSPSGARIEGIRQVVGTATVIDVIG